MVLTPGTQLGPYEVLAPIGAGGMGEVYRARDTKLDRDVAVKVLPERLAKNPEALTRFEREAKAVAALSHPNILAVYDFGAAQHVSYLVTELLEGETLKDRLRRSVLHWPIAVEIGTAIARGLAATHAKRIVHRDLKPGNVYLTADGFVKILDFGLARIVRPSSSKHETNASTESFETRPGTMLGTASYMSPEQSRGQGIDERTDIFSFGCVLYEMLTGHRAFPGETVADVIAAVLNDNPPDVAESGKSIPIELQRIITRCLDKEPARRFQIGHEIVVALTGLVQRTSSNEPSSQRVDIDATRRVKDVEASVAVLPFVNMSADKENEYFSDGLAEELTNVLSKIDRLNVASRTSAFLFKGKNQDIREIAEKLNVRTILEGSVRKSDNRLRITAQLVNAADGFHLWSETFDRRMHDIFAIQEEIAQSIAKALQVVLSERDKRAISKEPTPNVQAYEYYLRGRHCFYRFRPRDFEIARKMFMRAYDLDPGFAGAYAGVAACCSLLYIHWGAEKSHLEEANVASQRALELDPELAEAHAARGLAVSLEGRYDEARGFFEAAIRLKPDLFEAYYFYARACFAERKYEQAARLLEHASVLRPDDITALKILGMAYSALGRQDDTQAANRRCLEAAEKQLELVPNDARALYFGAIALAHLGERDRALSWANRALVVDPEEPSILYNVACTYALLRRIDNALDCLEKAVGLGMGSRQWFENDPDLDPLRSQPRFHAILDSL